MERMKPLDVSLGKICPLVAFHLRSLGPTPAPAHQEAGGGVVKAADVAVVTLKLLSYGS